MNIGVDRAEYNAPPALRWVSPEGLQLGQFHHEDDVWSFGVLLWEVLTLGATPYATSMMQGIKIM